MGQLYNNEVQSMLDSYIPFESVDMSNMDNVLALHPTYYNIFDGFHSYVMGGGGPISLPYKHFLAIMAAARHKCKYLIDMHKGLFLESGGDPTWLEEGLAKAPKKLTILYDLNKILAHRPWTLTLKDIQDILVPGEGGWTVGDLMHALGIMCHYHALCSFIYGCHIGPKRRVMEDLSAKELLERSFTSEASSDDEGVEAGIDALMKKMRVISESKDKLSNEEWGKRLLFVDDSNISIPSVEPSKDGMSQFIRDADFTYKDFPRHEDSPIKPFNMEVCSWTAQGFSLACHLSDDIGNMLDDRFRTSYGLTYFTMGTRIKVDTSLFRRAVWNYTLYQYGITYDDYNYDEVEHLIGTNLKAFIKTAGCYPERVTRKQYSSIMKEFLESEKIHVNMMIMEARLQAELMYALRVIMDHFRPVPIVS